MKIRVFKNTDGSAFYNFPSKKYQGGTFVPDESKPVFEEAKDSKGKKAKKLVGYESRELTPEDCKIPLEFENLPFIWLEEKDLPLSDSKAGNYHEMIYFDGDCCKENLKQDKEWKTCLMPPFLIREKHLERLNRKIDELLEKNRTIDAFAIVKSLRDREKCAKWTDKELYEQALKNIEEDGHIKPLVCEKLKAKIKEAV